MPDEIVDLIYYSFDLLQNIQQQKLVRAPSQHCSWLLEIQLGGWPLGSLRVLAGPGVFPGEEGPWLFTQGLSWRASLWRVPQEDAGVTQVMLS